MPAAMDYEVVAVYPHDAEAFTQGLIFHAGFLYESTGIKGRSSVRKVSLQTGETKQRYDLPPDYFGEGIAIVDKRLIQLTWRSSRAFVYDLDTLSPIVTFSYTGEGWGLTHDGRRLIMSDGSSNLRFIDPHTFATTETLAVTRRSRAFDKLNELEYIEGMVYANVYQSATVAVIDPVSGAVVDTVDFSALVEAAKSLTRSAGVLNGLAYDPTRQRLFITGKKWRRLYEIRLIP